MTLPTARIPLAALASTLLLVACQPSSSDAAPAGGSAPKTATVEISGAGASFVYPLMSRWSADYNAATGQRINYQSIGSGGGITQIKAGTVDFGSSDMPLPSDELDQAGLIQFPSTIGGVVPVVNLQGIAPGALRLDGALLADIFLGKVATWNDPAVTALNPELALPATRITIVHRSDGSGTTFNFTNYLSKVSPQWKDAVGEGSSVQWPQGMGGKGNEGVASYVQQIEGAIGYVELAYALQNTMAYATMRNAAGNWVHPDADSFAAAAATADWSSSHDFNLVITNAPGQDAWPITATNFMLMQRKPGDPARARATLDFFRWAFAGGRGQAAQLHYVPLPDALVTQIQGYWDSELQLPQQ